MKYKLDENGNLVKSANGHPIMIGDDGKEFEMDAIGAAEKIGEKDQRIADLSTENKDYRKKASTYKKERDNVTTERDTLQGTVDSIGDDKKVEVQIAVDAATAPLAKQIEELTGERDGLTKDLRGERVSNVIATSKALGKTTMNPKMKDMYFSRQFNDDGTANGWDGKPIYLTDKPGELAKGEAVLEILVKSDPDRSTYVKGTQAHGSGSEGAGHGGEGDPAPMSSVDNIKAGLAERGIA